MTTLHTLGAERGMVNIYASTLGHGSLLPHCSCLEVSRSLHRGFSPNGPGLLDVNSGLRNSAFVLSLGHLGGGAWTGTRRQEQVQEVGSDTPGGGLASVHAGAWPKAPTSSALPSPVDALSFTWSGTGDSA